MPSTAPTEIDTVTSPLLRQPECGESAPDHCATPPPSAGPRGLLATHLMLVAAAALLGLSLLASGAAGLINQVVWQRALKVFLGGSETVCSTVVVLVFMAGLGIGSWWSGARASRIRNPLRTFAILEGLLGCTNMGVWLVLTADVSESVFAMQRLAMGAGVPLLLMYAVGAAVVLFLPCLLMGATMPLAAQVCQSQLGLKQPRLLAWLFFINTFGSVAGAVVSSGTLIPQLGLSFSMMIAALLNLAAAGVLCGLTGLADRFIGLGRTPNMAPAELPNGGLSAGNESVSAHSGANHLAARRWWMPGTAELMALGLGFCSLGYEMHLFRLMPLKHLPLPFTFAAVLSGFLAFWSLGAALSSFQRRMQPTTGLKLCAVGCVLSIALAGLDSYTPIHGTGSLLLFVLLKTPFFLPCILFGYLFTQVTERAARSWGRDVGRICVWNTTGSCLGILGMTFIGYQIPFFIAIAVLALVLLSLTRCARALDRDAESEAGESSGNRASAPPAVGPALLPLSAAFLITGICLMADTTRLVPGYRLFCGRDGVIVVHDNGDLVWDGLWHSKLSDGTNHIGTHNWHLGVMPVICHADRPIRDVCVIGVGTGITASTLAKLEEVHRVDAYDISRVLEDVFDACPQGTLLLTDNPKINLIWQDARSGLELNSQRYDIIQTQPLYLKQAGSALLNSVEFFELISRRLKPGGVFCLYSNGTPAQAYSIRQTADQVFPFRQSFFDGYLVILSMEPIHLDAEVLRSRLQSDDRLWQEIAGFAGTATPDLILDALDEPGLPCHGTGFVITDDHPIVEYPQLLAQQIQAARLPFELPRPDSRHSHHDSHNDSHNNSHQGSHHDAYQPADH